MKPYTNLHSLSLNLLPTTQSYERTLQSRFFGVTLHDFLNCSLVLKAGGGGGGVAFHSSNMQGAAFRRDLARVPLY